MCNWYFKVKFFGFIKIYIKKYWFLKFNHNRFSVENLPQLLLVFKIQEIHLNGFIKEYQHR